MVGLGASRGRSKSYKIRVTIPGHAIFAFPSNFVDHYGVGRAPVKGTVAAGVLILVGALHFKHIALDLEKWVRRARARNKVSCSEGAC